MQKIDKRSTWLNVLSLMAAWLFIMAVFTVNALFVRHLAVGKGFFWVAFCMAVHVMMLMVVMYLYVLRFRRSVAEAPRKISTLYSIYVIGYTICIFANEASCYAMPITIAAILACIFFDSRIGFCVNVFSVVTVLSSQLVLDFAYGVTPSVAFVSVIFTGLLIGTLITFLMGRDSKRISFVIYGMGLNFIGAVLVVLYGLIGGAQVFEDPLQLVYLSSYVLMPVLLSLFLNPILERVFNVSSNFRFVELIDPHQPLLVRLAKEAPGTFNHSLTVANLVETCARAIGENVYLARCAAYYHDIGKLYNPSLFVENQSGDDINPHDELTPEASTDIIRKHTVKGEALGREIGLPEEVVKIAREHHGTAVIWYFYDKARKMTDGREVNIEDYSYPGPTPSSKIAALVMICDASEAAIRANNNKEAAYVDRLVANIIKQRLEAGQFDDCPITMRDLHVVRSTIVNCVCGLFHKRIKYSTHDEGNE